MVTKLTQNPKSWEGTKQKFPVILVSSLASVIGTHEGHIFPVISTASMTSMKSNFGNLHNPELAHFKSQHQISEILSIRRFDSSPPL
jgi:hypothetical protein